MDDGFFWVGGQGFFSVDHTFAFVLNIQVPFKRVLSSRWTSAQPGRHMGLSCSWVVQMELVAFGWSPWARPFWFWVLCNSFMNRPCLEDLA